MKRCDQPKDGDVVDMLLDMDVGALVFGLNGSFQSACEILLRTAFLFTTVDEPEDHMELFKLPLDGAPTELKHALATLSRVLRDRRDGNFAHSRS